MIVVNVLQQHADSAMLLASNRLLIVRGPHGRLAKLRQFDQRLSAHLDGLRLAGEAALTMCEVALEAPFPGALFPLTVRALEMRDEARVARMVALSTAAPETAPGLLAAFGWVEPSHLQGTVAALLAGDSVNRALGVAACAMHRVDLGRTGVRLLQDASPMVRARAYRSAGELGLRELVSLCTAASRADDDLEVHFWAAWSAALLGDRHVALDCLTERALSPGAHQNRSFRLAVQAMTTSASHQVLQRLAADPKNLRWLIQGSGIAGDPAYVPWLVKQTAEPHTARLAGEALSLITGLDLGAQALDRPAPADFESGPNDDPDDPNVDMDPDDGLPWPDPHKVEKWCAANRHRFQEGQRYFMGAPVTWEHCVDVLRHGYQRQRVLAAHYLCLLRPGTPLFNTSAPAWRQQRLLATM